MKLEGFMSENTVKIKLVLDIKDELDYFKDHEDFNQFIDLANTPSGMDSLFYISFNRSLEENLEYNYHDFIALLLINEIQANKEDIKIKHIYNKLYSFLFIKITEYLVRYPKLHVESLLPETLDVTSKRISYELRLYT